MKAKRKSFNRIIYLTSIVILLYISIPGILIYKAKKILKDEVCLIYEKKPAAPTDQFFTAIEFLNFAELFPGFTKYSKDIKIDSELRCFGQYSTACMNIRAEVSDVAVENIRNERDSVSKISQSSSEKDRELREYYDKKEDTVRRNTPKEIYSKKRRKFCNDWKLFIEYLDEKKVKRCDICD